jgi:hypothetical protein
MFCASTASSSHSKNLDLEEIKQNSIMLPDMPLKKHVNSEQIKKKKKKGLKHKLYEKMDKLRLKEKSKPPELSKEKPKSERRDEKKERKIEIIEPIPIPISIDEKS